MPVGPVRDNTLYCPAKLPEIAAGHLFRDHTEEIERPLLLEKLLYPLILLVTLVTAFSHPFPVFLQTVIIMFLRSFFETIYF